MTSIQPADRDYDRLVRGGGWLAAIAGLLGAASITGFVFEGLPADLSGWGISLGGMIGASVGMGWLWQALVPRKRNFSILLAALAGLLAGLAGHAAAWIGFSVALAILAEPVSFLDMGRAFSVTAIWSVISVLLIGQYTLPLAVAVAMAVTLWCRWKLGEPRPA